ncbi:hypothetical protein BFJ71_g6765 [Fusarium oxysporum]|nr:hypothetical protein BFJ71_g6765 [Fusarium oxysporum]
MTAKFAIAAAARCTLCRSHRVERLNGSGMARFAAAKDKVGASSVSRLGFVAGI